MQDRRQEWLFGKELHLGSIPIDHFHLQCEVKALSDMFRDPSCVRAQHVKKYLCVEYQVHRDKHLH